MVITYEQGIGNSIVGWDLVLLYEEDSISPHDMHADTLCKSSKLICHREQPILFSSWVRDEFPVVHGLTGVWVQHNGHVVKEGVVLAGVFNLGYEQCLWLGVHPLVGLLFVCSAVCCHGMQWKVMLCLGLCWVVMFCCSWLNQSGVCPHPCAKLWWGLSADFVVAHPTSRLVCWDGVF